MNIDWVDLFLKPSGRIGQKEFLIGIVILIALNIVLGLVLPRDGAISLIINLLLIYPGYCVLSSRFRDMGKAPWLAMLPYGLIGLGYVLMLVGVLGMAGGAAAGSEAGVGGGLLGAGLGVMLAGIGGIIGLIFFIWGALAKGDEGTNAYGPPPGDPTAKA